MIIRVSRLLNRIPSPTYPNTYLPHITSPSSFLFGNNHFGFTQNNKPSPIKSQFAKRSEASGIEEKQEAIKPEEKKQDSQKDDSMKPSKFGSAMLMASAMALLLAYAYMEIQLIRSSKNKKKEGSAAISKIVGVGKAQIGGDWTLTDTNGKPFGSADLQGSYYLIYFGFTHCPDICPNSLTKLSKAVARVKKTTEGNFFNLKTVFISVDPDRDSAQKMNKFKNIFDPEIIGVTGSHNNDEKLRQCMRKFKIYASKLQYDDDQSIVKGRKSYTIDHTILTYLMSDTNEYLAHLGANLGEHDLANIMLEKINEDKRNKIKARNI